MTVSVAGGGLGTRPHRQPAGMVEGSEGKKDWTVLGSEVRARAGRWELHPEPRYSVSAGPFSQLQPSQAPVTRSGVSVGLVLTESPPRACGVLT